MESVKLYSIGPRLTSVSREFRAGQETKSQPLTRPWTQSRTSRQGGSASSASPRFPSLAWSCRPAWHRRRWTTGARELPPPLLPAPAADSPSPPRPLGRFAWQAAAWVAREELKKSRFEIRNCIALTGLTTFCQVAVLLKLPLLSRKH